MFHMIYHMIHIIHIIWYWSYSSYHMVDMLRVKCYFYIFQTIKNHGFQPMHAKLIKIMLNEFFYLCTGIRENFLNIFIEFSRFFFAEKCLGLRWSSFMN